jgi:fructokinase
MSDPNVIVSWGELLWDVFDDGERLGGAAANVAYHLARLGNRSVLVSRVGADALGQRAVAELSGQGVATEFIQVDVARPTGTVRVALVGGEPRYTIATEVAWDGIEWRPELLPVLERASVLCYSTLAQRSALGFETIERALNHVRPACVRLCDLNIRPPFVTPALIDRALELATVVKLNEIEARRLSDAFNVPDPLTWLVSERHMAAAFLTLGDKGCVVQTRERRVDRPTFPAAAGGDPVGAGDAFVAVVAHGLALGLDPITIAGRANRYAGYVAAHSGAMPPIPAHAIDLANGLS